MPRKPKKIQNKIEAKKETGAKPVGEPKNQLDIGLPKSEDEFPLESWGLDVIHSFMRSDEDVIAVAYRIPTGNLAIEDIVNKYKSYAISALQTTGREKAMILPLDRIIFKVLPLGNESIIKAYCLRKYAIAQKSGEPIVQKPSNNPFDWSVQQ